MKQKERYPFDWLIALYRKENKWFDRQVNALNPSCKDITTENLLKAGARVLISKNSYLAKEGHVHIMDGNELPILTPKAKEGLTYAVKLVLSRRSEHHKRLYAKDIADWEKRVETEF